ncbi:MAG: LCP family protein [Thermomicrobiales bacterium]|nr:LCP family protein [Thermomicrobiales bacterium]MCO5223262.1 LCP family protein [Thermomicrobiales bacterium]
MAFRIKRRTIVRAAAVVPFAFLSARHSIKRALAQDDVTPADITQLTILAAGLDSREPDQPENADVFIIARVDVPKATVRAVSVPRDLYVNIPGFGYDKITRTYDFGSKANNSEFKYGAQTMIETVAENFGITADAVVATTFTGFEAMIEAVGGIEVENPYDLYDAEFPTPDYGIKEIFFPAGTIHLDGFDALDYVRTRHQDSDDGRVMRQRLVLLSMLQKVTSDEYRDLLPGLVEEHRKTIRNNLGQSRRLALALAAPSFKAESISFADLNDFVWGDTTSAGMWIYSGDWSQIPSYVQGFLDGTI